jgi:hypothetical protein
LTGSPADIDIPHFLFRNDITLFSYLGLQQANVFEDSLQSPLLFVEKQVIAVTLHDSYLTEGDFTAIHFTHCEVFPLMKWTTNVCSAAFMFSFPDHFQQVPYLFHGVSKFVTYVSGTTISLVSSFHHSYYHFLLEYCARFYDHACFIIFFT